jgi:uncharacterized protein YjdB
MNRRLARVPQFTQFAAALLLLASFPKVFLGQTLQISSPADGAVVTPGQTLTVTVNADPAAVSGVIIIGQTTLGITPLITAPPYQFSIDIPADITAGNYTLTALGFPLSGTGPILSTVTIDIERSDTPIGISSDPASIPFSYAGVTCYLFITGAFADGSQVALAESTRITYSSDALAVATVDERGAVTAVAPGSANITVTYAGVSTQVPVTVAQPVTLIPSVASLYTSQSLLLTSLVNMAPGVDQSLTWSISPQLGSIDQTGNYTAPSTVPSWTGVTVTATSVADPTKSASAQIWIFPPVSIGITPPSATLSAGQLQVFTARIQNGDFDANLSIDPSGIGTFLPFHGNTDPVTYTPVAGAEYYAPSSISSQQTLTITATSVADSSKTASAQITLVPSAAVAVSPVDPTVYALQTLRFTATINSGSSGTITWSLNPNIGTITAAGLYTAPSYIVAQQAVTVTAAGPSFGQTGTSILTLVPRNSAAIAVPTNLTATTTSNTEIDLSWAGRSRGARLPDTVSSTMAHGLASATAPRLPTVA